MEWPDLWRMLTPTRRMTRDVRAEISFHIEERVRELKERGWSEEAARAEAQARFGDVAAVEEQCVSLDAQRADSQRWRTAMDGWMRDVRLALRGIRRRPGFTVAVVLTLSLGIGAATSVFSVVDGVLLRALPFAHPDRLVMIWENDRATGTVREDASGLDFYDFRTRARSFAGLAMYRPATTSVLTRREGDPRELTTAQVSANLPEVLGVPLQIGRAFTADETHPGGPEAVILSNRFWRQAFDADPSILGRTITLDDVPHTVTGVTAASLDFPSRQTDAWVPLQLSPTTATRQTHDVDVLARLAPGVGVAAAQSEMTGIMSALEKEYPQANTNRGAFVERLSDVGRGDIRLTLWVLFGAVFVVLAIACVSVTNLLLARSAARARELAVLTAVGAGSGHIARRFLVEGLLLTALAAAAGIVFAAVGVRALSSLAPPELLTLGTPSLNAVVLAFSLAVSAVIGVGVGLLPALQARRIDVQAELKDGRTTQGGAPHLGTRRLLVAVQLAMSVVLLTGAVLLITTLRNLRDVDPGFKADDVLRMTFALPTSRYPRKFARWPNWTEINDFNHRLVAGVEALPGVRSAAVATNQPLDPGFTNSFRIEGRAYDPDQGEMTTRLVTPGYFRTVGLHLLEGRLPALTESTSDPPTVVLNRTAAARYFPHEDPLGHRLAFWGATYREVIGVVDDERMAGLTKGAPPAMYVDMYQAPPVATSIMLLVSTEVPPLGLSDAVRGVFRSLDPDVAVFDVGTMDETVAAAMARQRFASVVLSVFAGVAIFLALFGVHGVLAYMVAQRGHEVGVRMALGASREAVVGMILRQSAIMAAIGILTGAVGAVALSRAIRGLLYGISATAPGVYIAVALGLGVAALAATVLPARRAAAVDPVRALRGD